MNNMVSADMTTILLGVIVLLVLLWVREMSNRKWLDMRLRFIKEDLERERSFSDALIGNSRGYGILLIIHKLKNNIEQLRIAAEHLTSADIQAKKNICKVADNIAYSHSDSVHAVQMLNAIALRNPGSIRSRVIRDRIQKEFQGIDITDNYSIRRMSEKYKVE